VSNSWPVTTLPRHRLPLAQLDSLAGGAFDPNAISTLLSVERSRRLLLLRVLRDCARDHADALGPLSPVGDAWDLLLRAEKADQQVVEDLLADPQTGTWIGHTLGRLRGVTDDNAPLWFHVGQLHALAVAAAIRTGIAADMVIPMWNGVMQLPSLGYAEVPTNRTWGHAEVRVGAVVEVTCGDEVIKLDPRAELPGDGWFPAKRFHFNEDGVRLSVRLDDSSPYRDIENPSRPDPLPAAKVKQWHDLLDEAWSLLVTDHPVRAKELAAGLTSVTPLPAAFRFRPRSTSVEDGFGAAILSEPYDVAQLAVTLVHEFQHSVLNGVRHITELVEGEDPATGYAPWRDDPRPRFGRIHGLVAFTAIAEFWAIHRKRATGTDLDFANFEFALWHRQTSRVLHDIRNEPALTATGTRFLDRISERLARLDIQSVPSDITALADVAALDHDTSWRASHLQPDPRQVAALADAWAADQPAPSTQDYRRSSVCADPSAQRLDAKAALIRIRLTDDTEFNREPHRVPGVTAADVAFVAGDLDKARALYLDELAERPGRGPAWSGFGLTLAAMGDTKNAEVVLSQPELLRAVTTSLTGAGRPAPDELAAWLGQTG
jgi:HEXXH motif-containing protein